MNDREFAVQVVEKLQAAGYQALWAGGCVRDSLVEKIPKDYDVATEATPEQVRDLFGHKRTLPIGAAFGVITVLGPKPVNPIEVATFRRDSDYSDGRRPDSVEYTNAEEDARRRDFTINGMFYDPVAEKVIDYVGGQEDLQLKQIRAIGSAHERIDEDKLRMLRGVRFAATFDFELESETLAAIQQHAEEIRVVSPERIGTEIRRMFSHENFLIAVRLLIQSNLWQEVLPESVRALDQFDQSYWAQRMVELERLNSNSFAAVLTILFREIAQVIDSGSKKPLLSIALQDAWRLKNDERDRLAWLYRHVDGLRAADELAWSAVQPQLIAPNAALAVDVVEALDGPTSATRFCRERLAWPVEQLNPTPLIDGATLIENGIQPGPSFTKIIAAARAMQLDDEISTREEALKVAREFDAGDR